MALCEICGSDYLRCNCAQSTPYCDTCNENDQCNMEMDTACVIYHPKYPGITQPPSKLANLGMPNGSTAEKIFEALDNFLGNNANVPIVANSTNSILLSATGIAKHTLKADVKVSSDSNNQLSIRSNGLYAKPYNENYFVKVNATDIPDYLENQITGGTDNIVSISITQSNGLLSIQPSLNLVCLLNALENNQQFMDLICKLKNRCDALCATIDDINVETLTT